MAFAQAKFDTAGSRSGGLCFRKAGTVVGKNCTVGGTRLSMVSERDFIREWID